MSAFWASLAFAMPWILFALLLLPLLWWILRATPPAPKKVGFPAISLVRGLQLKEVMASKTPWWLLLLRLGAVAALIIAFAGPLLSPETNDKEKPLLLVIDDTAYAAANWSVRQERLSSLLSQAQRKDRSVSFVTTASMLAEVQGPMTAGTAKSLTKELQPKALNANRERLIQNLSIANLANSEVVWLSDGLAAKELDNELKDVISNIDDFKAYQSTEQNPLRLLPPTRDGRLINLIVERLKVGGPVQPFRLIATDIDGKLVLEKDGLFEAGDKRSEVVLDIPRELRNRLFKLEIAGEASVAAVQLMDDRWRSRSIGLIAPNRAVNQQNDANTQTNRFLSASFYLETALESFADVSVSNVTDLIAKPKSVLFWPDSSQLGSADTEAVEAWVNQGGTLVRFAGPNIANSGLLELGEADPLLPVRLRSGNRSIGGALDWAEAAKLESFSGQGSFADLSITKEVEIKRQVLAEPSLDLEDKSWATLEDGTPLVTSAPKGEGRLIFFHTTASPRWSNLSLSGLFVEMLQKIIQDSSSNGPSAVATSLKPVSLLDAFGRSRGPLSQDMQATPEVIEAQLVSEENQPGLYGTQSERRALNFSNEATSFEVLDLGNITTLPYGGAVEMPLKHWLLMGAFLALIVDFLIRMAMNGAFQSRRFATSTSNVAAVMLVGLMAIYAPNIQAQETQQEFKQRQAILETQLAYIRTGDARVDATSRAGLFGLTRWITRRSSIQLGSPTGLNLEEDELIFHPLIYWAVTPDQEALEAESAAKLNAYMASGGMLLVDTRDAGMANSDRGNRSLIRALKGLSIPALVPIPETHVLTKSFYLLSWYPGRWAEGEVWVAANATSDEEAGLVNDGVSPLVLGSVDWASAWAIDDTGSPLFPVVPGVNRQREFAYRFGTNLVMYALAGNYKADQVHVQSILDRLTPNQNRGGQR